MNSNNNIEKTNSKKVKEEFFKKRRAAAMAQMNMNNAMLMKKKMADNPALFELIESVARNGGQRQLLQLQAMLANYLQMADYGSTL